jgi:hypothetical protein
VTSSDGILTLVIPAGGVSTATAIDFRALALGPPPLTGDRPLGSIWAVTATPATEASSISTPLTSFNTQVEVLIRYGVKPPDVIAEWDGSRWVELQTTLLTDVHRAVAHTKRPGVLAAFIGPPATKLNTFAAATIAAIVVLIATAAANVGVWLRLRRSAP